MLQQKFCQLINLNVKHTTIIAKQICVLVKRFQVSFSKCQKNCTKFGISAPNFGALHALRHSSVHRQTSSICFYLSVIPKVKYSREQTHTHPIGFFPLGQQCILLCLKLSSDSFHSAILSFLKSVFRRFWGHRLPISAYSVP